nr:immunoglobulin heavy chain junction region [Macaca mulatta]MOV39599.1 immunoglobulin heavy chain junction region [Macaca mulatta]MOV39662.1 immunoglobulin heavy chain junction region [Macaca mulatta]MOV40337.1 immunoglobulin heavy chain junction region [Macaca mulatta]MOV40500.1 immunoglobulin heavy chain junction region [Macaca mulatta]
CARNLPYNNGWYQNYFFDLW